MSSLVLAGVLLAGCANVAKFAPEPKFKYEPRSKGGNKSPYTVFGKTYTVLESAAGYKARGIASWYGKKFHGRKTSNGERYNMYAVSAAHKSLPIPTFVKVTNLDNGKTLVVRINDRGPFHDGRIIDLSYAAALKLDMVEQGTANVVVEALTATPVQTVTPTIEPAPPITVAASASDVVDATLEASAVQPENTVTPSIARYLQVAVLSDAERAEALAQELGELVDLPVFHKAAITVGNYSVLVGPVADDDDLERLSAVLLFHGVDEVLTVYDFN